jgi:hypothetical protein
MLESTVELLGGLCLSALPLLISFCIVGSIVAAVRAVSRASATVGTKGKVLAFVREVTVWDDLNHDIRRSQMSGGNTPWLKKSARTGESCATPR